MNDIVIRPAVVDDAPLLALVVCMALDQDETYPFYPVFCELTARNDAQYSYCNAYVAECDGVPVGAVIGYDGAHLHELRKPLYEAMMRHMGHTIEVEEETSAGEFYIDSMAVLPQYRGKGIGRRLLTHMRDTAFARGHRRVGLLVDCTNHAAEALYNSMGFSRINPTTFLGIPMWHLQASQE